MGRSPSQLLNGYQALFHSQGLVHPEVSKRQVEVLCKLVQFSGVRHLVKSVQGLSVEWRKGIL